MKCRLGCGPTGCRRTHQRLKCFRVLLVDDSIRSRLRQFTHRQYLCAAGIFCSRPRGTYRLRRQSANTRHCHRQIVLCNTTSDSGCAALSSTTRPADTNPCFALVISKVDYCCSVLAGVSGHLLTGCSPSSTLPPDSCSQPLPGGKRTRHPASPRPLLVAGPGTDSIPFLRSGIHDVSMDQRRHISLRAFVGQSMWKVVATSYDLPP